MASDRRIARIQADAMLIPDPTRPTHYQGKGGMQVFDVIDAFEMNFAIGSAVKYLCRSRLKGSPIVDLKKAIQCITREIEKLEGDEAKMP